MVLVTFQKDCRNGGQCLYFSFRKIRPLPSNVIFLLEYIIECMLELIAQRECILPQVMEPKATKGRGTFDANHVSHFM